MSTPVAPWLRGGSGSTPQPRPKPNSSYTEQVAQGGLDALQQARQERRYGLGGAQQNYGETGVFSYNRPVNRQNDTYQQWVSSMMPQQQDGPYGFGRTEDGAYAGFKTQGALQAALRGRAEDLRRQGNQAFEALDMLANQGLDDAAKQYEDRVAEAAQFYDFTPTNDVETYAARLQPPDRPTISLPGIPSPIMPSRRGNDDGEFQSIRPESDPLVVSNNRNPAFDTFLGAMRQQSQADTAAQAAADRQAQAWASMADRYTGMAKQEAETDYRTEELNPWLAEATAPLLERQDFAQAGLATPIATYAQAAGAEYGVDPMIVGGWYPDASALSDARDQRDLDFLQNTGMTASQYEQALAELERNQAAAANEQAAAAEEANQQAIDMYGYEATGQLATTGEISQRVGVPPMEVISILDSEAFQVYSADIETAMSTGDPDTIGQTVEQVLADAAFTDPLLYQILEVVYAPLVPSGFDVYGGQ